MTTKQIASLSESSSRKEFRRAVSQPQPLREWAEFLFGPKEMGSIRLLMVSHHGSLQQAPGLELLREVDTRRIFVTALHHPQEGGPASTTPDSASSRGVPLDLAGFAAHALRDRFPPDIEEQIEEAWD